MKRKFLYVLVSDYPFGIGEPFFETELFILNAFFEKIYIVIPQADTVNHAVKRYKLPGNCELIELNVKPTWLQKAVALLNLKDEAIQLEQKQFREYYYTTFNWPCRRIFTGYHAMAIAFKNDFGNVLKNHNHPPESVTLYSYWFTYGTTALAMIRKEIPQYRAITRIHGWDCFYERNPLNYLPLRPFTLKYLNAVYSVSKAGMIYSQKKLPQFLEKFQTAHLGVQVKAKPINSLPLSNTLHIVSIAFIDPVKQLDKIAEALSLMNGTLVRWTHIGNEPGGGNSFSKKMKSRLENYPNISVTFAGELSKNELFDWLERIKPDVLVCTSRSEGLPVSMMEAFAFGIPVISVDVGGISEIVSDGYNGRLLPANCSAETLAAALTNFNTMEKNNRISWSENAYDTYNKYFSALKNYQIFAIESLQDEP